MQFDVVRVSDATRSFEMAGNNFREQKPLTLLFYTLDMVYGKQDVFLSFGTYLGSISFRFHLVSSCLEG